METELLQPGPNPIHRTLRLAWAGPTTFLPSLSSSVVSTQKKRSPIEAASAPSQCGLPRQPCSDILLHARSRAASSSVSTASERRRPPSSLSTTLSERRAGIDRCVWPVGQERGRRWPGPKPGVEATATARPCHHPRSSAGRNRPFLSLLCIIRKKGEKRML